MKHIAKSFLFVLCVTMLSFVFARPASCMALRPTVDSLFAAGKYEQVELAVLRAGESVSAQPDSERISVYLTTGYSLIMLERETEAREFFRRALDVNHSLQLDALRISPKFRLVFEDVKASYRPPMKMASVFGQWSGARTSSTLLNLVLPGVGEWREGEHWRGWMWGGAQAVTLGGVIWRTQQLRDSRNAYLHQTDRARVSGDYRRYERDSGWAWAAGISAAAVYLGAQVDLALFRKAGAPLTVITFPSANCQGVQISFRW